jgi:8-oxo-dGTP pyrophosphatase MutT (NUDIX family)
MKNILEQDNIEIRYSAAGLVIKTGDGDVDELLMIQRAKDDHWPLQWEFPRGGCEEKKDSNLRECAVREIKEETGLDVKPTRLIDKYKYVKNERNKKIITHCYNYKCILLDPDQEVHLSKEHDAFKWISEVGEVELMASPEQKKTIQRVLNNERSIVSYPRHQKVEENVNFYLNSLNEDEIIDEFVGALLPIYFSALLIKMAADVYKSNFSKNAKKCKGYGSGEKQICMLRAQISGKQAAISKIESNVNKCAKDKNPENCRSKLSGKVQTMKQEVSYLMQREKELRGKVAVH